MLFYTVSFILLLGPLVFVHELGHFLFAKLFNVRVDTFSMGFGPKFFKKQWGETEYCLSAIPLGGYVKLFGQDPTEVVDPSLKHRALRNLEAWKRFLVFVGGPLFNFVFAIFVFAVMLMIGESHLSTMVARVVPGSQAYQAGFRSGDIITAVDRNVVLKFEEVNQVITTSANKELVFRVRRAEPGQAVAEVTKDATKLKFIEVKATPQSTPGLSLYGEPIMVGSIEGLASFARYTTAGVSNPASQAALAGLKTGDEIVSLNGVPVKNWEFLESVAKAQLAKKAEKLVFGVVPHEQSYWTPESHPQPASKAATEITLPAKPFEQLGLYSSELFVASVMNGAPAQVADVQPGDRLVSLDGQAFQSFSNLKDLVQKAGEEKGSFTLLVERQGKMLKKEITPTESSTHDPTGREIKQYLMGVFPLFIQAESEFFVERIFNPFTLTVEAWSRAIDLSAKTFISIKKLFFRQVSMGTLGGPILIGKLAGDSMSRGLASFLKVMALISISLAIFNILPIPILDGGHIFLLLIEVVRGRPISMKQTEMVQQVGLSIIVLLLVVVLFNDISRVGLPALRQMFQ